MGNMNAAVFNQFGDPAKVMEPASMKCPEPAPDEVVVRMTMSPIHNHDLILVRGEYGVKPELPAIGGSEAVGTVSAVGSAVTDITVGTRVAIAGGQGTWAEYFAAPAASVVPMSDQIDDRIAAQLLGMPMDAVLALDQFGAKPGDWILVNAGNGAVGKVIAAVGRSRGLKVALLVRRKRAKDDLEAMDFDNIFVTEEPGWEKRLHNALGDARVAGAVDMVGGTATGELASFMSPEGLLLSFGAMSNKPIEISASDLVFKQITLRGFWSHQQSQKLSSERRRAMISELVALATSGDLPLSVEQVIPLDQAPRAMAAGARSRSGKVLIAA